MKNYENYHASLLSRKIFEGKLMFMMTKNLQTGRESSFFRSISLERTE